MQRLNIYTLMIIIIPAICGLLFGFDTSTIAGALPFIKQEFHVTSESHLELVVSICVLGALFGALLSGLIADYFGRRKILLSTGIVFIIGSMIAAYSNNVGELIIGRFIIGFAIGTGSFVTPLFIAEIAPCHSRGKLVLWNGVFLTGGQVLAFFIDYIFSFTGNWRMMILSGMVPATVLVIGMVFMPESPKWLIAKHDEKKALKTLGKIYNNMSDFKNELSSIKTELNRKNINFFEIFTAKLRGVLLLGILLGIFQQFMGINTIMYYGPQIMQRIGFSNELTDILGTLGFGITNFIFTLITLFFIDKIGRRKLLMIGTGIAAFSLFIMSVSLHQISSDFMTYLTLVCLITYIIGYCISVGSLFWLLISEIFPLRARGACMSFVVAVQWGANFLVTTSFLSLLNTFGATITFGLYCIISITALIFIYFKVPETNGVSLESIEHNLENMMPIRRLGK